MNASYIFAGIGMIMFCSLGLVMDIPITILALPVGAVITAVSLIGFVVGVIFVWKGATTNETSPVLPNAPKLFGK